MNDREFNALKRDIKRHCDWWCNWLGLNHWEWRYIWERTPAPDDDVDTRCNAQVYVDADRMQFTIQFWLPSIARTLEDWSQDADSRNRQIERIVIHEMAHVLVAELRPQKGDKRDWDEYLFHEERVVAQLVLALTWVANEGQTRPRLKGRVKAAKADA